MPMTLAVLLDWLEVRVLAHRLLENRTVLIKVESTLQTTRCHRYGREIDRFHGFDRSIRLRLIHSTVADISRSLGLGVKAVEGILDAR